MKYRFQIENRYQDEGWTRVEGEHYADPNTAISRAQAMARDPIVYGMTRVVDLLTRQVIQTYSAGGPDCWDQLPVWKPNPITETCARATMQVSMMPKWKQTALGGKAMEHHLSPNFHQQGSLKHAAEAWLLSEGLVIPNEEKHPLIYRAMLDEFIDTLAFAQWEAGE